MPLQQPPNYFIGGQDLGQVFNENLLTAQKAKAERAAAEAQRARDAQLQKDLEDAAANPSVRSIQSIMIRNPQLAEKMKPALESLSDGEKQFKLQTAQEVYGAFLSGSDDQAIKILEEAAVRQENTGNAQEAAAYRQQAENYRLDPKGAALRAALFASAATGPEKMADTFSKFEEQRRARGLETPEMRKAIAIAGKAEAETQKARTEADFAESGAMLDLKKRGWDIEQIKNNIQVARLNSEIALKELELKKEKNDLERLKLQQEQTDLKDKRDEEVRKAEVQYQGLVDTVDNSLSTVDRLLNSPALDDVVGSFEGGLFGSAKAIFSDEQSNALADIDAIVSQTFLNAVAQAKQKGATFGQLTEKEGEKLQNSVQSLRRTQGEKQFRENLRVVQKQLLKYRSLLAKDLGISLEKQATPDRPQLQPQGMPEGFRVVGVRRQ